MISEQDVQTYKRDGVVVIPDVLGAATLAEVRNVNTWAREHALEAARGLELKGLRG